MVSIHDSHAFSHSFLIKPYRAGILSGLTFAVKDVIDIENYKTGCGNPTWEETHPSAPVHAICVEQLLTEGASCTGKTICDELAFSLLGENHFYGTPLNPKAPDRIPGGSSSGSASAVACGLVDFALGTDTGGSVRAPASYCGLLGFRPSHGRISFAGVTPLAPSFDTVGLFAKSEEIFKKAAAILLGASLDSVQPISEIVFLEEAFDSCETEIKEEMKRSVETIRNAHGGNFIKLNDIFKEPFPFETFINTFRPLQIAEIWNTFGGWIESIHPEFGPRIHLNFSHARSASRLEVLNLIRVRQKIKKAMDSFLGNNRILCIPTTGCLPRKKGTAPQDRTSDQSYRQIGNLMSIAGLCSLPQITLPFCEKGGIPLGISFLAGNHKDEGLILSALQISKSFSLSKIA